MVTVAVAVVVAVTESTSYGARVEPQQPQQQQPQRKRSAATSKGAPLPALAEVDAARRQLGAICAAMDADLRSRAVALESDLARLRRTARPQLFVWDPLLGRLCPTTDDAGQRRSPTGDDDAATE
jgi:hypothetical protein